MINPFRIIRIGRGDDEFPISGDMLSPHKNVAGDNFLQIISQDDIGPAPRGKAAHQMFYAEMFGSVDGPHLNGHNRGNPQLNRAVDHEVDMAFFENFIGVLVIGA